MFCSKCGKEIADEAVICPQCGCATANYHSPAANKNANPVYSQDYIALKEFEEKVNGVYAMSIIALVLFLGIGIIFSIATWLKAKNIVVPKITTTSPNEIAMFEASKRKLGKAFGFANAPLYVLLIVLIPALIYSGMWGGAILVFVAILLLLFLILIPSAKNFMEPQNK